MNKTIVITGANRGIGLSFSKLYKQQGCTVYAVCREASSELKALNVNIIEDIDVGAASSIEKLSNALQNITIDVLINNAGMMRNEVLGNINYETIESQFQVNTLGPLRVTESLIPQLASNAKVAMITSRMGSIEDNTSGGRYGYRISKAALNMASVSLAHDIKDKGIAVAILHPGLVGTDMIGGVGDITPDQAAERLAQRIEELNINNTGTFWHSNGEVLPW